MEIPNASSTRPPPEREGHDTSPSVERSNNFFGQEFFSADWLDENALKDIDLGYLEELFGSSANGQMSLMNTPVGTFESPQTTGFEHLNTLENLDIASLLVKKLPSTTTAPPQLKFINEGFREYHRHERNNVNATFMLPTVPFDSTSDLEILKGALQWNRALQARIRADLQAIDNGLRMQAEYIRTAAKITAAYKNSLLKHRRPLIPGGDVPDPDPFSLLAQVSKAICKYAEEQDQRALNKEDIENYHWIFETLVPKYMFRRSLWGTRDKEALAREIRMQNQKLALEELLRKARQSDSSQIFPTDYHKAHRVVREMSDRDLELNLDGLDWKLISRRVKKTEEECKIQWVNHGHPLINDGPWTMEEIKRLSEMTKEMDTSPDRWSRIAEKLGTNRPVGRVIAYYQEHLNKKMFKSKWTREEDEYLMAAVAANPNITWSDVAEGLDGRTAQQCFHRYTKSLDPEIKHGKWTPEEDAILTKAVSDSMAQNNGRIVWRVIKDSIPNRTDSQCRERWINTLDPSVRKGRWTEEERKLLMELVAKHGEPISWTRIATEIPGRTDAQCRRRWEADSGRALIEMTPEEIARRKGGRPRKIKHSPKDSPLQEEVIQSGSGEKASVPSEHQDVTEPPKHAAPRRKRRGVRLTLSRRKK